MKRDWKRWSIVLGIILVNVILDQWTKELARLNLQGQPDIIYWEGLFRLTFVENRGAFLSMGAGLSEQLRSLVLQVFPVILLVGLLVYTLRSLSLNRWQIIGLSFIIGGGLSNVYDRLLYGQVVDFMHMRVAGIQTGIFNIADVAIMIGLFIMLPFAFQRSETAEKPLSTDQQQIDDISTPAEVERSDDRGSKPTP